MKFHVINLGCKVNRVESDTITAQLIASGATATDDTPDVIIVNTCTVTGEAEKKTRKAVRRALREHPQAHAVIVTGCAAAISPDEFLSMDDRVRICGKDEVKDVSYEALHETPVIPVGISFDHTRFGGAFPTRVGLKIQDGCDGTCTYCIVRIARGESRSRALKDALAEAEALIHAGARELVLTGINLGTYTCEGYTLAGFARLLYQRYPQIRVRISSVEPEDATEELLYSIEQSQGHICNHLHLPLQSGSTRVLREMQRPYTAEEFFETIQRAREILPSISLSTDIIVGFPGETEKDFEETLEMVKRCRFSKVHIFRYSQREGTQAAARSDQLDPLIIAARAKKLQQVSQEMRLQDASLRTGSTEWVLVESHDKGMSDSYYAVELPSKVERGSLIAVTLGAMQPQGCFSCEQIHFDQMW